MTEKSLKSLKQHESQHQQSPQRAMVKIQSRQKINKLRKVIKNVIKQPSGTNTPVRFSTN